MTLLALTMDERAIILAALEEPPEGLAGTARRPDERASSDALAVFVRCATIAYPSETPE